MEENQEPFRVGCSRCGDAWIAFWLPKPIMEAAAALEELRCPYCIAESSLIRIAIGEEKPFEDRWDNA